MDNRNKAFNLSFPFKRLLKFFASAFFYTLVIFSLLLTFLPRAKIGSSSSSSNTTLEHYAIEQEDVRSSRPRLSEVSPIANSAENSKNFSHTVTNINEIKNAFNSGKYVDLSVLRPEMLGDTSIKEASFIPEVKNLLLKQLFNLMDKNDWYSWKDTLKQSNSERSKARIFVDDVRIINFQLGRYLETAALLVSALYLNTTNGRIFSSEEALFNLINQSNDLFTNRTPTALSPRIYLDTMITDDISFTKVFEELRSKLVASYCLKRPQELDTQLLLLGSIDTNYYTTEIVNIYLDNLKRIDKKVSPRFREELRTHYLLPDQVKDLVEIDSTIGEAVENLYSESIRDYLKQGDIRKAKSILLQLASFASHRADFEILSKKIEEQSESVLSKDKELLASKGPETVPQVKSEPNPIRLFPIGSNVVEKVSGSFQGYAFIFALFFFILLLFKRVRELLFVLLLWVKNRLLKTKRADSRNMEGNELFTNELDASIKSGKTVPMASITRSKGSSNKKAVNS